MISLLTTTIHKCIIIAFGVLYPAYNSYKALNRRDGYEQVRWMMYWVVYAAFTAAEVLTDIFLSWLPLYYEAKIAFVLWLVLPITRGSSLLYRKIIHPKLMKHENDIDQYIAAASNKGCEFLLEFGQHGMNVAATAVLKTADHLKKSYSVGDLSQKHSTPIIEEVDVTADEENQSLLESSTSKKGRQSTRKSSRSVKSSKTMPNLSLVGKNSAGDEVHLTRRPRKGLYKLDEEC